MKKKIIFFFKKYLFKFVIILALLALMALNIIVNHAHPIESLVQIILDFNAFASSDFMIFMIKHFVLSVIQIVKVV